MRHITLGVILVWVVFAVGQAPAAELLGFDGARHLLNRSSFAANVDEIKTFAALTREQAADRLLATAGRPVAARPPQWVDEPFVSLRMGRGLSPEERKEFQREQFRKGIELRAWWVAEMLSTASPLTEKMTLFWHNHFVSSLQKVRSPQLMYRQNMLLRHHALGNFAELLHAIAKDPAMVIYLDSVSNRKGHPNENFAREVMELFTLGEGHYTERDIQEAARAFTGWSINRDSGELLFRPAEHDDGVKTVLGRTGDFDGAAVLDILLGQSQTAEFVVAKLWREFVSPAPDAAEVKRIASLFRDSRYDIRVALRAILVSDAFYSPAHRASLVKSPVELAIGTLRQFNFTTGESLPFVFTLNRLGQNLFAPPNVRGWPGGEAWINSSTLLGRRALLARLFRSSEEQAAEATEGRGSMGMETPPGVARLGMDGGERFRRAMEEVRFDDRRWLAQFASSDSGQIERVLLAAPPASPSRSMQGTELIRHLVYDAVYQLK
jgi:uncharacterized protein (DUF1800 family)